MSEAPRIGLDPARTGTAPGREDGAHDEPRSRRAPDAGEVEEFMRKLDGSDPGGTTGGPLQDAARRDGQSAPAALAGLMQEIVEEPRPAGEERAADAGPEGSNDAPPQGTPTPFDLFRPGAMASSASATQGAPGAGAGTGVDDRLEAVAQAIERMTFSDGSTGGEREVRVELRSNLLPGTELRIAERAGELQVEFVVTDPKSGAWLSAQSESMAGQLAERLRRDVRVRVRAPDADANTAQGDIARRPDEPVQLPGPAGGPGATGLFGDRT